MESHISLPEAGITSDGTPTATTTSVTLTLHAERPPEVVKRHKGVPRSQLDDTPVEEKEDWDVAFICCVALVFCASISSTSGLFYVYFMDAFGVNREAASWPSTTMGVVQASAGLVVMLLQRFLTVFQISLLGSVFLWVGVIASSFVTHIEPMALCLGALHGFGHGVLDNTMAVTIGIFYRKNRGVAMGVKDSGRTLCVLIFPSVVSKLNAHYGFRGALLICGALLMNVTAFMLLLRRPKLRRRGADSAHCDNKVVNSPHSRSMTGGCKLNVSVCKKVELSGDCTSGKRQFLNVVSLSMLSHGDIAEDSLNNKAYFYENSGGQTKDDSVCFEANYHSSAVGTECSDADLRFQSTDTLNAERALRCGDPCQENPSLSQASSFPVSKSNGDKNIHTDAHSICELSQRNRAKSCCSKVQTLLGDPRFYILVFQNMVMNYWAIVNRSISVDYALDKGVPIAHAELIGTYSAATDLILGHVAIPFLADRGYLKRSVLAALTFALLSAALIVTTFARGLTQFMLAWITASFLLAATVSFSPVLVADCLGASRVPVTWGMSGLITGPLLLATPSITGFFRDTMGSYDNLVRLVGALAALAALLVLLLPSLERNDSVVKKEK